MLETGLKGEFKTEVNSENTAAAMKSGELLVFATPAMIAAMEAASVECVSGFIGDGESTVGTKINIEHISATPVGMKITAASILTEIDGKRLTFDVVAEDECGVIGRGTHERFIVNKDKFVARAGAKKEGR